MTKGNRTPHTPGGYRGEPGGRASLTDKVYVGKVKDNRDTRRMGRLTVWIPELSQNEENQDGWVVVSFCSPFAGATNVRDNTNQNSYEGTQKSYGMWMVPPDLNVQVLCVFANGDPARGYWIGCLYDEQMNHMVPGIASTTSNGETTLPKSEYNRKLEQDNDVLVNPNRPNYTPLMDSLVKQGLNEDNIRGLTSTSARRTGDFGTNRSPNNFESNLFRPAKVYGWLTPGGSQLYADDGPQQKMIRFRTQHGTQILIDDTNGLVYLINRDGTAWVELSKEGHLDAYSRASINLRAEENVNIRADQDINLEAGQSINVKSVNNSTKFESGNDFEVETKNNFRTKTNDGNYDVSVGGDARHNSSGGFNIGSGTGIYEEAPEIHLNGPSAASPEAPSPKAASKRDDIETNGPTDYQITTVQTIVDRFVTREPFPEHEISTPLFKAGSIVKTEDVNVKEGQYSEKQTKPADAAGSTYKGGAKGVYKGTGYSSSGKPQYEFDKDTDPGLKDPKDLNLSESGVDTIAKHEGYREFAYDDSAGNKTIGFGHKLTKKELESGTIKANGKTYNWQNGLSKQKAKEILKSDAQQAQQAVRENVNVELNQNQFDALTSFTYNVGGKTFRESTLVEKLNNGQYNQVPSELQKYTKARDPETGELRVVQGLKNRRQSEARLFTET